MHLLLNQRLINLQHNQNYELNLSKDLQHIFVVQCLLQFSTFYVVHGLGVMHQKYKRYNLGFVPAKVDEQLAISQTQLDAKKHG